MAKFYSKYIKDKEILFLVKIGLTLRKLENDKERQHNLRDKIFRKFKVEGLHIAEFVQKQGFAGPGFLHLQHQCPNYLPDIRNHLRRILSKEQMNMNIPLMYIFFVYMF